MIEYFSRIFHSAKRKSCLPQDAGLCTTSVHTPSPLPSLTVRSDRARRLTFCRAVATDEAFHHDEAPWSLTSEVRAVAHAPRPAQANAVHLPGRSQASWFPSISPPLPTVLWQASSTRTAARRRGAWPQQQRQQQQHTVAATAATVAGAAAAVVIAAAGWCGLARKQHQQEQQQHRQSPTRRMASSSSGGSSHRSGGARQRQQQSQWQP